MADVRSTVLRDGAAVLPGVLTPHEVDAARDRVLRFRALMKNTRPTPSQRHLAGFHRFPDLEPLHAMLTQASAIRSVLDQLCGPNARTIGMTDITVNRSQPWHKDLLRGDFATHLDVADPCARWHGSVFKVLAYLQDSASLRIVRGSHRQDLPLDDDEAAVPSPSDEVVSIAASAGDVVILDICTTHAGSPESAFAGPAAEAAPKILVSTVVGAATSELTDRMELGNAHRMAAWMARHR